MSHLFDLVYGRRMPVARSFTGLAAHFRYSPADQRLITDADPGVRCITGF